MPSKINKPGALFWISRRFQGVEGTKIELGKSVRAEERGRGLAGGAARRGRCLKRSEFFFVVLIFCPRRSFFFPSIFFFSLTSSPLRFGFRRSFFFFFTRFESLSFYPRSPPPSLSLDARKKSNDSIRTRKEWLPEPLLLLRPEAAAPARPGQRALPLLRCEVFYLLFVSSSSSSVRNRAQRAFHTSSKNPSINSLSRVLEGEREGERKPRPRNGGKKKKLSPFSFVPARFFWISPLFFL